MANLGEFNGSLETTRKWIDELMFIMAVDETKACKAFRATLHELRDHLPPEEVADLAAQFPLLLRGVLYDGWRPSGKPTKDRTIESFLENVSQALRYKYDFLEVEKMVRDVLLFLDGRVSAGEVKDIVNSLPKQLRTLWPVSAGDRCSA